MQYSYITIVTSTYTTSYQKINGIVSVDYLDRVGKTIAIALASNRVNTVGFQDNKNGAKSCRLSPACHVTTNRIHYDSTL